MQRMPERRLTKEDLDRKWRASIMNTEKAIRRQPECFGEIKRLLAHVVSNVVDIDEYDRIALGLARRLATMGPNTIFDNYFLENIHPAKSGNAKYFRFVCQDLLILLNSLSECYSSE